MDFVSKSKKIHGHKYNYDKVRYVDCNSEVTIKCPYHGEFEQRPIQHLVGHGCPICYESRGEKVIRVMLEAFNIPHQTQYRTLECKNKRALPFDFAVWVDGILRLIEFQGKQHYEFGFKIRGHVFTKQSLREIQQRDKIKLNFCSSHGIPLLVIPYWERKNIGTLVIGFLRVASSKKSEVFGEHNKS